ncbi:MAG: hypothetical protein LBI16_01355 [Burkholderiales bacterium]|nr:hypothetical protein [Burkholderiales bacterium]
MDYVRRGAIQEPLAGLSDGKVKMEQHFMDNRAYACNPINVANDLDFGQGTQAGRFFITCALVAANPGPPPTQAGYTLTARGRGIVANFTYTVNNRNVKATTGTGVWGKTSTGANSCWVLKKDGSC